MTDLKELANKYVKEKKYLDEAKEIVDRLSNELKTQMAEQHIDEAILEDWRIVRSVRKTVTFDEDKLLAVIRSHNIPGVIKTKEYVDEDALETAIYNGQVSSDILQGIAACRQIKQSVALTIKAKKEEK